MTVAVLVPRRADGGHRDQTWQWVRSWWAEHHPDWAVHEGHHDQGPFNRSAAINAAAEAAGDWTVAVIADADSFVGPDQARAAVDRAVETGRFVLGYDRYVYVGRSMSGQIQAGWRGDWWPGVEFTMHGTCSSVVVVTRDLWDQVGGFDEGFVGWGFEDIGFSLACQTLGGGLERIPGEVWHLWHAPAPRDESSPEFKAGKRRMDRYAKADTPAKMRSLIRRLRHEQKKTEA